MAQRLADTPGLDTAPGISLIFLMLELARLLTNDHLQPEDQERKAVLLDKLDQHSLWVARLEDR